MSDTEMIDWLEGFVNREGALVLHDGNADCGRYSGLGLRPGFLNRTLREAIVQAAGSAGYDEMRDKLRALAAERDRLRAELAEARRQLDEARANNLRSVCVYCGHVTQYDSKEQKVACPIPADHLLNCQLRPERKLLVMLGRILEAVEKHLEADPPDVPGFIAAISGPEFSDRAGHILREAREQKDLLAAIQTVTDRALEVSGIEILDKHPASRLAQLFTVLIGQRELAQANSKGH